MHLLLLLQMQDIKQKLMRGMLLLQERVQKRMLLALQELA